MSTCLQCGEILQNRQKKYCCNQCQQDYEYYTYIISWQNGNETGMRGKYQISNHIKRYLLNKYNNKCCQCGWSKVNTFSNTIPLEIDHIDGNYYNNNEDNLRILCPNCHSLTQTYKGANKGGGRKERKQYKL